MWPHGGSPSDLIASIQGRLSHYPDCTEKVVVFDKYKDISAKDYERMRRAGEVFSNYDLSIFSLLPKRDAILKSKNNKRRLASVLSTFDVEEDDSAYGHDEADITMLFRLYVLESANNRKGVICVLSDDTYVFVLLVYWVHRADLQCRVQMERLDSNATSAHLVSKCFSCLACMP